MMFEEIESRLGSIFEGLDIVEAKETNGKIAFVEEGRIVMDKILSLNSSTKLCRYGVSKALHRVVWHIDD